MMATKRVVDRALTEVDMYCLFFIKSVTKVKEF